MQNSQRQLFEQQIQLLHLQIEQQNKRQSKLRQLIDTLTQQMQYQRQIQDQNYRLTQLNQKLLEGLKQAKNGHNQQVKYCDIEIYKLKQQIQQKINQIQRNQVQFQKRQLVYEQKIAMLESIIQKKCHRVHDLQKKLHIQSINQLKQKQNTSTLSYSRNDRFQRYEKQSQRLNSQLGSSTLRISNIDYSDNQNNMRASNLSMMSKKSKATDFLKMDKSQMKVAMKALITTKKQMEKADVKCNQLGYKANKTMLN